MKHTQIAIQRCVILTIDIAYKSNQKEYNKCIAPLSHNFAALFAQESSEKLMSSPSSLQAAFMERKKPLL